jgi:putative membrane protein
MITRFTSISFVIFFISSLLPGLALVPFPHAVLIGFFLAGLGYFVEKLTLKKGAYPFSYGLIGFIVTLTGLTLLKLRLLNLQISWLGLLLTSLIIGLIDLIIPSTINKRLTE